MGSMIQNEYNPDFVSPPGATLRETLEALGLKQKELAARTGTTPKHINEIIKGKAAITYDMALLLERALGVPASFWNNRERRYQEFRAREQEKRALEDHLNWLKEFPISAMVKAGWIAQFNDKVQQLQELLSFFGVASPESYKKTFVSVEYRKSSTFEVDDAALAAWLRKGELEARDVDCEPYDSENFRASLKTVRELTLEPLAEAKRQLVSLCAASGVAVVVVPELPRTRVSGATRWLTPQKALIQLSLRYKKDDRFWFSFFHEAGHILLDQKKPVFVDFKETTGTGEKQADRFASDQLIPSKKYQSFVRAGRLSKRAIRAFAKDIDIAPGVVVGRLQFDGHLSYKYCNDLKRSIDLSAS